MPVAYGTKKAVLKDWPKKTLADMADPDYFAHFKGAVNIGALLGPNSDNLVSIDVDSESDAAMFFQYNPHLATSFRSQARRGPNVFLRMDGDYPGTIYIHHRTEMETNGKPRHIGEFRSKGCMTIVSGRHPEGIDYRWIVDAPPLRMRFEQIVWPPDWSAAAMGNKGKIHEPAKEESGTTRTNGEMPRLYLPNAHITVGESTAAYSG